VYTRPDPAPPAPYLANYVRPYDTKEREEDDTIKVPYEEEERQVTLPALWQTVPRWQVELPRHVAQRSFPSVDLQPHQQ